LPALSILVMLAFPLPVRPGQIGVPQSSLNLLKGLGPAPGGALFDGGSRGGPDGGAVVSGRTAGPAAAPAVTGVPVDAADADASPAVALPSKVSAEDDRALEDVSRRAFRYFWEQVGAKTGLVADRARGDGSPDGDISSSASTGFGLTALCIGAERGWVARDQARERALKTLRFLAGSAPQEHGWFYHYMDAGTGARAWESEVSSIDTAFLLAGVLTARQCFNDDGEIPALATAIYDRVDFKWMLNGHPTLLSHGWKPESGFLPWRWDGYSEHMALDLLAIGSPTHPVTSATWGAWKHQEVSYSSFTYVAGASPLFIHQYSHAWVDFRGLRDGSGIDYFENSVTATLAQKAFCQDLSREFPGYSEDIWGITASDSANGYVAWGGPPRAAGIDGTVCPSAALGSLMFTPEASLAALRAMRGQYGEKTYGRYGFADAFNPNTGWVDSDVIGIDQGIILLSAENLRHESVWHWFMSNPEIARSMRLAGFEPKP